MHIETKKINKTNCKDCVHCDICKVKRVFETVSEQFLALVEWYLNYLITEIEAHCEDSVYNISNFDWLLASLNCKYFSNKRKETIFRND